MTLLETWHPTLPLPVAPFQAKAATLTPDIAPNAIDITQNYNGCDAMACFSALCHTDDGWGWTALLVLRSDSGHTLWVADHKRRQNSPATPRLPPAKKQRFSVPATVGNIIQLNVHHTHWMPRSPDGGLFVALFMDYRDRLPRDEIEKQFMERMTA